MKYKLFHLDYWTLWEKKFLGDGTPRQPDPSVHHQIDRSEFNSTIAAAENKLQETLLDPTIDFKITLEGFGEIATLYLTTDQIGEFNITAINEKIKPLFKKWKPYTQ